MTRRSLALEKAVLLILAILILILGVIIIAKLYEFGALNIKNVNTSINETMDKIKKT